MVTQDIESAFLWLASARGLRCDTMHASPGELEWGTCKSDFVHRSPKYVKPTYLEGRRPQWTPAIAFAVQYVTLPERRRRAGVVGKHWRRVAINRHLRLACAGSSQILRPPMLP